MALYVWGSNASQQLGLDVDDKELYDVRKLEALGEQLIVDFSAGENHSLAVNEFGDVFAWGRGKEGQLGLGQQPEPVVRTPQRVAGLDGQIITKVSCGDMHSLALSAAGEVFMWGLLPETRHVRNDGAFDHASVSLAGLSQQEAMSPRSLRGSMADSIMSRLMRDSELVYEAAEGLDGGGGVGTDSAPLADLGRQKVQTVRHPSFLPRPCASLARVVVTSIAAGFAHSLATSAAGAVFSCGYNDNGQLGTGSRRNAADFQRVQALDGVAVAQVACGQQHSLACARGAGACYSWGLGILGQLGSGINISWLPMRVDVGEPVVAVAAGSHHSVAVAASGLVYSWGHSEYGQHGAGELFYDLQRGAHYFYPRVQESLRHQGVAVAAVACSSHSTFARARDGSVYSWGWNAFGVLGVGKYQHSVHPQKVFGLRDNAATHVGAGSNHGAAVVQPRGAHHSLRYARVLQDGTFADVAFDVRGAGGRVARETAHRVVVCARSSYLHGLLRAAAAAAEDAADERLPLLLVVDAFRDVDAQVFRALLGFLYTQRVEIASHKRKALAELAARVCLDDLVRECADQWRRQRPDADGDGDADAPLDGVRAFASGMQRMVLSPEFADVVFLWPADDWRVERLPAHKAVLAQVDYFRTMFTGGFSEGSAAATAGVHEVELNFMHRDGVTLAAFRRLLRWIYTGSFALVAPAAAPDELMDLFVGANLLGLSYLASLCELELVGLLALLPADSVAACLDFAERFDARRLETLSRQHLRKLQEEEDDDLGAGSPGLCNP